MKPLYNVNRTGSHYFLLGTGPAEDRCALFMQVREGRKMDYEVFKKEVKDRIISCLPEEYQNWKVEERQVYKINRTLDSFHLMPSCEKKGTGAYPTFYYNECFELLHNGMTMNGILHMIAEAVQEWTYHDPVPGNTLDMTVFRDDIICAVVSQKWNTGFLETIPHRKFLDLAVIYRVHVYEKDGGRSGMTVTNEYLEMLGMSLEELHEHAMKRTLERLPAELTDLNQEYKFHPGVKLPPIFMLSNTARDFGAAMILYTDVMDMAAEVMGGSFYILPGSIHELYLVPESPEHIPFYRELVANANRNVSDIGDWLSDHIYLYNAENHRLTLVTEREGTLA